MSFNTFLNETKQVLPYSINKKERIDNFQRAKQIYFDFYKKVANTIIIDLIGGVSTQDFEYKIALKNVP